jgi:hypothetical protein
MVSRGESTRLVLRLPTITGVAGLVPPRIISIKKGSVVILVSSRVKSASAMA